jgi:hypothetical protein
VTTAAATAVTGRGMSWCHRDATLRGAVGAAMIAVFAAIGAGGGKKTKNQRCENSILHDEVLPFCARLEVGAGIINAFKASMFKLRVLVPPASPARPRVGWRRPRPSVIPATLSWGFPRRGRPAITDVGPGVGARPST